MWLMTSKLTLCMWLMTSAWEELVSGFPLISSISSATSSSALSAGDPESIKILEDHSSIQFRPSPSSHKVTLSNEVTNMSAKYLNNKKWPSLTFKEYKLLGGFSYSDQRWGDGERPRRLAMDDRIV
jgi:hypothetical protein